MPDYIGIFLLFSNNYVCNLYVVKGTVNISTLKKIVQEEIGHDWKQLARSLKFVETDIQAIEHDNVYSLKEQIYQFFYQWERMMGNDATPEVLLKGVVEARLDTILDRLHKDGLIECTGMLQFCIILELSSIKLCSW